MHVCKTLIALLQQAVCCAWTHRDCALHFIVLQTEDLELKKLVYLYLINYAKTQPDLAIMAVNTFVKVGVAYATE